MKLGIVSNCWQVQLGRQVPLEELLEQARQAGFHSVELRQGALGRFESPDTLPLRDCLAELPRRFAEIRFSLAMAVPFLDPRAAVDEALLSAGIAGACAVAGHWAPHLRLVDLKTSTAEFPRISPDDLAAALVQLAAPLAEVGGCLSVENAREPWHLLVDAVHRAHHNRPDFAAHLKICYDPVNLLTAADAPDTVTATELLTADALSMVHFKQQSDGPVMTTVAEGKIDWSAQIAALTKIGYDGPGLFEIAPDETIWRNLSQSREYLKTLGLPLDD